MIKYVIFLREELIHNMIEQYMTKMKEDKTSFQKMMADEYTKEKMIKDEDERIKVDF